MNILDGHTIENLTFDVQIPNENAFHHIADLISSITEHELSAILEALLNKYNIQDQTIRIPKIELDLGNISINDIRNQLITQFKSSLEIWFEEKFKNNNYDTDSQINTIPLSDKEFNLIKYFISYGKMPWWGLNPPFFPDVTLKKQIREERIKTKELIFSLGKIPSSRKRIIYQFKDDTLYQLFGILSPRPSSFFKDYATDLTEIHQKQKVVEEEDRAFKKVLQELILTYLISHTATSIDQTAFFKKQLLLLSKQYGISYKTLLDRIDEAIKTLPETYPQKFGIKSIVRELLKRDFRNIPLPKSSGNIGFSEYTELLTLFYTGKPNQIIRKYHSKRERDRLIRVMLKRNKKKTFLILSEIHRKLKINKTQSAALFSESILLEMMEIWQPSEVKISIPIIDSFHFLHQNYLLFSGTNLSVRGIIYSHFLAHSFTEKKSEVIPASRIIKSIAKSFNLNTEFLLKKLFSDSISDHPKLKNQVFQMLNKEKQLIFRAPTEKTPGLPQLKNILAALLGTHFSLFEELIKKVSTLHPTLHSFVKQPAAYVMFIQKWMDKPERSDHFPNFVQDLIHLLSQRIPGDTGDMQKSLLTHKSSFSPKLFSAIQSAFKSEAQFSRQEARNLFSDPEYTAKLDLPQLKNILAALLGTHFTLFEELIKKVNTLYPTLHSFVKQPAAYVMFIQKWMDKPERSDHFPNFVQDLIHLLSQRIPGDTGDMQKSLLTHKSSFSPKLFSAIQSAFKSEAQFSRQEARNLFSDPEYTAKLDLPQLKNILAALLGTHFTLFEELIKKVNTLYPTLHSFVKQPAFYLFLIDIIRVSPSNAYKMDQFFLKVISRLAHKSKMPIKGFLSPFFVTKTVIPDKLMKTLGEVYKIIKEKDPTSNETDEMPVKEAESMGKLMDILGAELFENISTSERTDKTSLFLESLVLDKDLVLEKLYEHKFNPNIPALLVYGLSEEALQLLQMSISGTFYHELIRASKDLMNWISRFNIIKFPRKKMGLWIKQQTLSYILLKEGSSFHEEEYFQFILEKMQKGRMIELKELEKTVDKLSTPLQNEVYRLIAEKNKMPIPKARRDQQFFRDILIHYFITGKIQGWLNTPYLEIKELEYTFKQALHAENVLLVKSILAMPMNLNIFNRLRAMLSQHEPLFLIQLIDKIFPEKSLLSFYQSVSKITIDLNISPDMSESVFRIFMQKKLWMINNQMLRFELMRDGLNDQYKYDIALGEINIRGQAFSLSWFEYYVESGFWPEGFPEEQMNQYLDFLKLRILENPLLLLQITGKTSYHSFHQVILRRIFSVRELASIFKKIIPIKNISSPILTQIIEEYLAKGTKYLQKYNFDLLLDSILNLILFERKEPFSVEQQLLHDLQGILPEIKPLGKSNAKFTVPIGTEKDFELLDYYLTYGSLPLDYPYFDAKNWRSILENLKIKAPGNLQDQLHIWSKTPYKLNRLLELVSEEMAISFLSMINKTLYEQITLLEKSVESVLGEKMRLKIGIQNEKALVRQILLLWGKTQKMQVSPIPILFSYFSVFLERKRLQPTLILTLFIEKLKNVPSKQINVLKSLKKYVRDTRTETIIKKEKPPSPEGTPQDSIYIANAGLVLLWPFLGRFFRRLNLVGAKEFIDEASLMRGILLTQYLVSGKKEAPEYELALNKLLCGAEMDMEIDSEIELTEEEINLSNSLLTGAITNWEKLKGTRIGTFRETFLQRNGYLYYLNNRWELKVEKKAYDLLLETLPWGIQMIQMSWMKERLVVLWR